MTPDEHAEELAEMKLALESIKMLIAGLDAKISEVQGGQVDLQVDMQNQKDAFLAALAQLESTGKAVVDATRALREFIEPSKKKSLTGLFASR